MSGKRILVLASGGGTGFEGLVRATEAGVLDGEIIAVVSNLRNPGVRERANRLGVMFDYLPKPRDAQAYQTLVEAYEPDLICLSGYLLKAKGLPVGKTINIHPGLLTPEFSGPGKYGHFVHEAVYKTCQAGRLNTTAVSMHFVTEEYDAPQMRFFEFPVAVRKEDSAEDIACHVNEVEHAWQPWVTNLVVQGLIQLHFGKVYVPRWYYNLPFCPKHDNLEAYDYTPSCLE